MKNDRTVLTTSPSIPTLTSGDHNKLLNIFFAKDSSGNYQIGDVYHIVCIALWKVM